MNKLFSVKDKCVVVTGGAGILCQQMVIDLAEAGARVCIVDHDKEHAETLAKSLVDKGYEALALYADILDKGLVEETLTKTIEAFGKVDVLVNGAGGNRKDATCSPPDTFFDIPDEAIKSVFDLNFIGSVLPSQVYGKHMADNGEGVIINISSMNAFRPLTNIAAYSAAKAAISNFTQWLSTYMAQRCSPRIRVNAIAPGFFLTNQNRFLLIDEKSGELTKRGQQIIDHTPMGEFGKPEDLTGVLMWLISDASRFVTGIVVPVDGGFSAYSGV
ncbi:MAG: SDR family oxidoreductase [Phycisphaerae bacterium]|nr:SDR family oxidoreductase [Phycisphaerae bacterium]